MINLPNIPLSTYQPLLTSPRACCPQDSRPSRCPGLQSLPYPSSLAGPVPQLRSLMGRHLCLSKWHLDSSHLNTQGLHFPFPKSHERYERLSGTSCKKMCSAPSAHSRWWRVQHRGEPAFRMGAFSLQDLRQSWAGRQTEPWSPRSFQSKQNTRQRPVPWNSYKTTASRSYKLQASFCPVTGPVFLPQSMTQPGRDTSLLSLPATRAEKHIKKDISRTITEYVFCSPQMGNYKEEGEQGNSGDWTRQDNCPTRPWPQNAF